VRLTPAPLTPPPGTLLAPYLSTPVPTTLGSSVGQLKPPGGTAKWFKPAMIGVFAAMVVGIILAIGFSGKTNSITGNGSETERGSAGLATGSGPGSSPTGAGSAATGAGSAATGAGTAATGAGSAATGAGSAATGADSVATGGGRAAADAGSAAASGSAAQVPTVATTAETGSAGTASLQHADSEAGHAEHQVAVEPNVEIAVSSTPSGARIFVDGTDTGKLTPATLSVPKKDAKLAISLHLKGYTSVSFKADRSASSQQRIELPKSKLVDSPPARCRVADRAGCTRDAKGCCLPEGSTSGGRGSGKPGSENQGSADPDGLMHP